MPAALRARVGYGDDRDSDAPVCRYIEQITTHVRKQTAANSPAAHPGQSPGDYNPGIYPLDSLARVCVCVFGWHVLITLIRLCLSKYSAQHCCCVFACVISHTPDLCVCLPSSARAQTVPYSLYINSEYAHTDIPVIVACKHLDTCRHMEMWHICCIFFVLLC